MAKRRSHFWAFHFKRSDPEVRALSQQAMDGFEYATSLARNALDRRTAVLRKDLVPARLTSAELAGYGISPIAVNRAIQQARIELFGQDLSDSAIAYRLAKRRERPAACTEPACPNSIPRLAHARQRYCKEHGSVRARVARHRRIRADQARGARTVSAC
jgi:hypothetical protein